MSRVMFISDYLSRSISFVSSRVMSISSSLCHLHYIKKTGLNYIVKTGLYYTGKAGFSSHRKGSMRAGASITQEKPSKS